jgi:hypothetical protein
LQFFRHAIACVVLASPGRRRKTLSSRHFFAGTDTPLLEPLCRNAFRWLERHGLITARDGRVYPGDSKPLWAAFDRLRAFLLPETPAGLPAGW